MPAGESRVQRQRILAQRAVRGREIRGAAHKFGQRRSERVEGRLRRLPGGERLGLRLRVQGRGPQKFVEAPRQNLPTCAARIRRPVPETPLSVGRRICPRHSVPRRAPSFAPVPPRANIGRYFERRRVPAQAHPRAAISSAPHRFAVHGGGTLLVRGTPADHGLGANERRSIGDGTGRGERGRHRLAVLTIDPGQYMPAVSLEAPRRVVGEPALDSAVDGNAVVVVDHDQLAELLHAGERGRFMRNAFHQAAVAEEHVGVMIDNRMARPIERRRERAFREGHTDPVGKALAERSGGGLDAQVHVALRMSGRLGAELAELLQLVHRQRISREVQHRIQQH